MEDNRLNEKDKSGFFSKLSRTLYAGNLNENINDAILYKYFGEFGDIISINIKKEDYVSDGSLKVYANIKYFDTSSVVLALHKMNGIDIEGSHVRLGFGKSYPSRCVWITGIKQSSDNNFLMTYLAECGPIITFSIDQINKRALVYFKEIKNAEAAINKLKDGFIQGLYFYGDFASSECQAKFADFFNKKNHKNCSSKGLDNVDGQNPSISNVNKQNSAESHYVEEANPFIPYKKSTSAITCTWIKGIPDSVTTENLESCFSQFGPVKKCFIDRFNKCGMLCFQEELHAQSAVSAMDCTYIEGELLNVCLASFKCEDCEVSFINNKNLTIKRQDNTTPLSPSSPWHDDHPSCKRLMNINNQRNNSIKLKNAHNISQHKYLSINDINIPNYYSNHVNDKSVKIIFNEYPEETYKYPIQYAHFDVMSLPLPEFAKNISEELTTSLIKSETKDIEKKNEY